MKLIETSLIVLFIFSLSACSRSSFMNGSVAVGTALGSFAGMGIGAAVGESSGMEKSGALLGSVAGAAVGSVAGVVAHKQRVAKERAVVVRRPFIRNDLQASLDAEREKIYEASSYGQNETKSWEERYIGENENIPYQGSASPTYR